MSIIIGTSDKERWQRIKSDIARIYPQLSDKQVVYAVNQISNTLRKYKGDLYDLRFYKTQPDYYEPDFNEIVEVAGCRIYLNGASD